MRVSWGDGVWIPVESIDIYGVTEFQTSAPCHRSLAPLQYGDDRRLSMWYACEYPERPPVLGETRFHCCCRPCLLAAQAAAHNDPITDDSWWHLGWEWAVEELTCEQRHTNHTHPR